jgi:4-amino-4-deoxy-L-arabinose transferase-like glycosyltransferase
MNSNDSAGISTKVHGQAGHGLSPLHIAFLGLAFSTLFRLWYVTQLQLVPDEAYYWLWSKHLAASYRDKGPAIAWTIALGTALFGDTVFGIRCLGVLLATGTAYQLFRLARRLYDDATALWCLLVALVLPLFAVGSVVMTIDSLSVFFWAWAVNVFWTAVDTGRIHHWVLLGLVVGAGFLAKFTNGVQLACFALFLLWSPPHRRFLVSRQSLLALVAFGVCVLPVIWWNVQTGWVHAQALHSRSGLEGSFQIRPREISRYLGGQLAVLSPFLCIGVFVATFGLWRRHGEEARVKYLLSQFVPVQALFLFFSLNSAGQNNWIAPTMVTGIVLLVVFWRDLSLSKPSWRWVVSTGLGVAIVMTFVLHFMILLPLPPGRNPVRRAEGWPDFAKHIQQARERTHADLLTANHYSQASIMQFYLQDRPTVYLPPQPYGETQFTLWPSYQVKPGTHALYVTDDLRAAPTNLPIRLREQFDSWTLVDDFWSQHLGHPVVQFRIYLLVKN